MSDFKFKEENNFRLHNLERQKPAPVRWLLKTGLAKNEKQANWALLFLALFILISSFFIFHSSNLDEIKGTNYSPESGYGGKKLPDNYR